MNIDNEKYTNRPFKENKKIYSNDGTYLTHDLFLTNGRIVNSADQVTRSGYDVDPNPKPNIDNQIKENFENLMDNTKCSLNKSSDTTCETTKPDSHYWIFGEGAKCNSPLINYENDQNCKSQIRWMDISKDPANEYPYLTNIKIDDHGNSKYFIIDNSINGVWGGYCSNGKTSEPCCRDTTAKELTLTNHQTGNVTFSCPQPKPTPRPTGYYKCTNSDKDTVNKGGKTYTRVQEVMDPPGIPPGKLSEYTEDPSICNLTQDLLYMRGKLQGPDGTIGTGSRPICQLINCRQSDKSEPGYSTIGKCLSILNPKGGSHVATKYQALDEVYVPNGVSYHFYNDWTREGVSNSCTSAAEYPGILHHDRKWPGNAHMGPPDGSPVSTLEGGCNVKLSGLDDKNPINSAHLYLQDINPHACDGYSFPEPFDFPYPPSACGHCPG